MSENSRNAWLQAAIRLVNDPSAIVDCPECAAGILLVQDIYVAPHAKPIERELKCSACGAANYILKPSGSIDKG